MVCLGHLTLNFLLRWTVFMVYFDPKGGKNNAPYCKESIMFIPFVWAFYAFVHYHVFLIPAPHMLRSDNIL